MKANLIIALVLSFLFELTLFAQCKYERNEVDDMTNKKVVITRPSLMINQFLGSGLLIKSAYMDGLFFLNLQYSKAAVGIFRIEKQAKIIFKFEDNSLMELENTEDIIAEMLAGDTWNATFNLALNDKNIEMLQKGRIIKIRIYTSKGIDDMEIKAKNQDNIINMLKCIKSAL
jgi:hypothetical protein